MTNELVEKKIQLPAYMQDDKAEGKEGLRKHIRPPIVKVVQDISKKEVKDVAPPGSVIIMPEGELQAIAGKEEEFGVQLLFMFDSWCKWNDIKDTTGNAIMDSTTDPTSELAMKAKSMVTEVHPTNSTLEVSYYSHINYVAFIMNPRFYGNPVIFSFLRGEYKRGTMLSGKVFKSPGSIYALRWNFATEIHKNPAGNEWWGFSFSPVGPVSKEEYELGQESHNELKKLYAADAISVEDGLNTSYSGADTSDSEF